MLKIPRPFSAARTVSSTNRHWENKISTCKRTRVDMYLTPYIKINSKWIKHLKVRLKTIKLLAKNIGGKLHDIGFGHDFLTVTPKDFAGREMICLHSVCLIKLGMFSQTFIQIIE